MSDLLVLRALLFAGECFLASLLLPFLGFAVTALLRRAALRHLVWTTLFGVLAVLPLVALLLPPRRIVEHVAAPVPQFTPAAAMPVLAAPPPSPPDLLTPGNVVLALVALWLLGLAWQGLRLGVGMLGLMRLRRRSAAFATPIETGCAVRLSRGAEGPSTFGILRPLILLPCAAAQWPAARLEAVLRHEAAHVARRDTASQALARLVCAVFWLNPLLWLAYRALRREAEIAADDAVLASGMTPSLYAAELVGLAAESQGVASSIPLGIAMARPPLVNRVQSVLAENSSRKGVTKMDMARIGLLGLTAALLLGVARFDIAVAQDAPAPARPDAARVGPVAADTDRIKARVEAQADAAAAAAMAKAEAEIDAAKRQQYRKQAEEVAAQAANVKANAERLSADTRRLSSDMAQRIAADKARAEDMRRRADVLAKRATDAAVLAAARQQKITVSPAEVDERLRKMGTQMGAMDAQAADLARQRATLDVVRTKLAEATPPGHADASASSSADSSVTINGGNKTIHIEVRGPGPDQAPGTGMSGSFRDAAEDERATVHVDVRIADSAIKALPPGTGLAITTAVNEAVRDAGRRIDAAIAAATAHVDGVLPIPPAPPPVPPVLSLPPPPHT
jgi:beta-lactamase regulating signal transducer with metallopeptidase domain